MLATNRSRRATIKARAIATRLAASCKRRPRSIATHFIAAGVNPETAGGAASGMKAAAKRIGLAPALTARTRKTVKRGRAHITRPVTRWTRGQVQRLIAAYRPRKAEYVAAVARLAATYAA
ncbi:hypothetical protein [Streptomyces mirabilis]|uniref:hypothetical protein n=1 Tax=Streptomyces mirabilis TaxID=68239 RepID=UPI003646DB42